jgi:hypothetical protein
MLHEVQTIRTRRHEELRERLIDDELETAVTQNVPNHPARLHNHGVPVRIIPDMPILLRDNHGVPVRIIPDMPVLLRGPSANFAYQMKLWTETLARDDASHSGTPVAYDPADAEG